MLLNAGVLVLVQPKLIGRENLCMLFLDMAKLCCLHWMKTPLVFE